MNNQRIEFVQNHQGWKVKLQRYLQSSPIPEINWAPTVEKFVKSYEQDIDKSISIIEAKSLVNK